MPKPKKKRAPRSKTERLQFTQRVVESLKSGATRRAVYDAKDTELGLRIEANGRKSWFWFRTVQGKPKFKALGRWPATDVDTARAAARELTGKLDALKRTSFNALTENPFQSHRGEPTLDGLLDDYCNRQLGNHAKNPAKAEKAARWLFNKYLNDWSSRKVSAVQRKDVLDRHGKIGEESGQIVANRVVQLLRTLYNFATSMELWSGPNPAARIKFFRENSRDRFLQNEEMPQFWMTLRKDPSQDFRDFVIVALFTSARRGDVLSMRWNDISFQQREWVVPEPKARVPYIVTLEPEVLQVLAARKRRNKELESDFVFPSFGASGHLENIGKRWKSFLERAKLKNLRPHDLRRTMPSHMAMQNVSLPIIGKRLGHQSLAATQVYARLNVQEIREPGHDAARALMAAAAKKPKQLPAPK